MKIDVSTKIAFVITVVILAVGSFLYVNMDHSTIYENSGELSGSETIKLNWVKVASETDSKLTLDFSYTYHDPVPAKEIKLFVLPDHSYWNVRDVKVSKGTHEAQIVIGLSTNRMKRDDVYESDTGLLRFNFEHYAPSKYKGSIWGEDIEFKKHWKFDGEQI